jgi:hypothetical protein
MPHLLIAWATGSWKSVWVNDFILSLMYQNNPNGWSKTSRIGDVCMTSLSSCSYRYSIRESFEIIAMGCRRDGN